MKRTKLWHDHDGIYRLNACATWKPHKKSSNWTPRLLLCLAGLGIAYMFVYLY